MVFDFSNYVDYDQAMNIYDALRKLTNFGQTILQIAAPNTFKSLTNNTSLSLDFNDYNMQLYHKYLNPLNLIPPFDGSVYSIIVYAHSL